MSFVQRSLSEYLQCELYHSLGAYGVAQRHLGGLANELERHQGVENGADRLLKLVEFSRDYNQKLREHRHSSRPRTRPLPDGVAADRRVWPARDPLPEALPLTEEKRFYVGASSDETLRQRRDPWQANGNWRLVPQFYSEAIEALKRHEQQPGASEDRQDQFRRLLSLSLITARDGRTGWDKDGLERRNLRLDRYKHRIQAAHIALSPDSPGNAGIGDRIRDRVDRLRARGGAPDATAQDESIEDRYQPDPRFLERIATEHLSKGEESLGIFVVRAQAEAHLSMHAVEAWKSMCLGEHAESLGEAERHWLDEELDRSIVLSTFAYCLSRTAPWLFAKDDTEQQTVCANTGEAWENVVPPRCMWIANQIGLLALHRRAYAWSLRDQPEKSYNDYHKLQQRIRDTERRVWAAPVHADGALEFLAGLNAEAHHHIGELYRAEHAHKPALEHFEAASHRLNQLRAADSVPEVLVDSRWNVQLHVSHGKACYEMGRHKEALYWYLRAWCAFLELFASSSQTETNAAAISAAIEWLDSVKFEPELRKSEISEHLRPVVDQLDRITAVGELGALAADILLRLGHLLFVLNIGDDLETRAEENADDEGSARDLVRRTLAFACLAKAAECDPHSTLAAADLLKTSFRLKSEIPAEVLPSYLPHLRMPATKPIGEHWPHGGNDYEQLTRAGEYMLLREHARKDSDGAADIDARIARGLLLSLFMSTDSINVRKAQIHRFLMKGPDRTPIPGNPSPAIEFVCMRRYSSPFPLLPRPSAFRALGGGYFLRLHDRDDEQDKPFGVVIDPGVDFVENLYRTGFSLSDIDMVVLTHDHVDHLGALDPLLSLLHVRSELLSQQAKRGEDEVAEQEEALSRKKVKVLTSRSVAWRYDDVARLQNSSEIDFECFEESELRGENGVLDMSHEFFKEFPDDFEIVVMSSAAGQEDGGGHKDLSLRPSHGLCFRTRDARGPSLAITSDTPSPPASGSPKHEEWLSAWRPALDADVLVVHLSSVPLTELRRMDQAEPAARTPDLPEQDQTPLQRDETDLLRFRGMLQEANTHLRGQIEYAQWLRSHMPNEEDPPLTAPLVGRVPDQWLPPTDHNYLDGLLCWAKSYLAANGAESPGDDPPQRHGGLFVVGELSEELASMRGKIATHLNDLLFDIPSKRAIVDANQAEDANQFPCVLTADIGLHICATPAAHGSNRPARVKVLCTTCNLDTDRAPGERYHLAHGIYEVCVKGENEGIFYNCLEHDPRSQDDPTFLEQLERFDIFGR